jgi:hypothetical protein
VSEENVEAFKRAIEAATNPDVFEVFAELHLKISEIRDLEDRIFAIGRLRPRGTESGAETQAELGNLLDFKNHKAVRLQTYLDPKEALEAAGLRE